MATQLPPLDVVAVVVEGVAAVAAAVAAEVAVDLRGLAVAIDPLTDDCVTAAAAFRREVPAMARWPAMATVAATLCGGGEET